MNYFSFGVGRKAVVLGLWAVLVFARGAMASESVPAAKQERPVLLTGATVHTVSGEMFVDGKVLIVGGKIGNVGGADLKIDLPGGTEVIDLAGKHIYPGLIAANTVLGLTEVRAVRATVDTAEVGKINPNARARVAVNPDSELIPVARTNGVLVAQVVPLAKGSGSISGTSAVMALDGWTWEDMTVRANCGLHFYWPTIVVRQRDDSKESKERADKRRKERDSAVEGFSRALDDARAYVRARDAAPDVTETDLRWEAMRPLLAGEVPAFFHANSRAQIRSVLAFAKRQKLAKVVIVGAQDAWRLAEEMKAQNVSAILSPINELPMRRWERVDVAQRNPQVLLEAGVKFCIANSGGSFEAAHERNLPYQAARALLSPEVGIRAITLDAAEILGVADRLGSVEVGKDATLIVTDGDPLDIRTNVERAFIGGREIDLSNRQTRLFEKYRKKYGK